MITPHRPLEDVGATPDDGNRGGTPDITHTRYAGLSLDQLTERLVATLEKHNAFLEELVKKLMERK